MDSRSLVPVLLACTLTSLLAASQAPTQPPQDPQRPPTFRTEANFVRVDVFATRQGTPVRDLKLEEFEVLEDGVAQKLSTFEYVHVRTGTPQELRDEPNTIQQSRDALKNPRARVFVLFLDVPHVTIDGTWHSRRALANMLEQLMGPEDLVGLMTPFMSPDDIVFARKTAVIEGGLFDRWPWGERHTLAEDPQDQLYQACYPWEATKDVVAEMTVRRKERATLDAFADLIRWLRDQREERKAIITVSEGWLLYRPNTDLTRPRVINPRTGQTEPIPGVEPFIVGPNGKITVATDQIDKNGKPIDGRKTECDRERLHLSLINNEQYLRDIMDWANRANASFYTIDPRGLAVFDHPIGPAKHPGLIADANSLKTRTDALRVLADNTDGMAVIGSNDLGPGLRRMSDDLTSYYLVGYYSSNARLDGRFRKLTVRIKRPGVDVRARRGYKAATREEVEARTKAAEAPPTPEATLAIQSALGGLARLRPEAKLHTNAVAVREGGTTVWFAGELARPVATATTAVVTIVSGSETTVVEAPVGAGQRSFAGSAALKAAVSKPIDVRVRVAPAGEIPFTDAIQVDALSGLATPMMFRRGPSTGNRIEPAGQPQFSRTERARFEVRKVGDATLASVRILDRNGNPVDVPIVRGERDGWFTADITLASLGPGDFVLELSGRAGGAEQKVFAPFRVTR